MFLAAVLAVGAAKSKCGQVVVLCSVFLHAWWHVVWRQSCDGRSVSIDCSSVQESERICATVCLWSTIICTVVLVVVLVSASCGNSTDRGAAIVGMETTAMCCGKGIGGLEIAPMLFGWIIGVLEIAPISAV